MREPVDLVVIGGGSAGLVAAKTAAGLGATVTLIERDRPGGDCLWTGCVPSKALLAAARRAHDMRRAARVGLRPVMPVVDFPAVMASVRAASATLEPPDSPATLRAMGVRVVSGAARFTGPDTLSVDGAPVPFRRALIATGARPALPDVSRPGGRRRPHHRDRLGPRPPPRTAARAGAPRNRRRRLGGGRAGGRRRRDVRHPGGPRAGRGRSTPGPHRAGPRNGRRRARSVRGSTGRRSAAHQPSARGGPSLPVLRRGGRLRVAPLPGAERLGHHVAAASTSSATATEPSVHSRRSPPSSSAEAALMLAGSISRLEGPDTDPGIRAAFGVVACPGTGGPDASRPPPTGSAWWTTWSTTPGPRPCR